MKVCHYACYEAFSRVRASFVKDKSIAGIGAVSAILENAAHVGLGGACFASQHTHEL
jgi:hypothetical protein